MPGELPAIPRATTETPESSPPPRHVLQQLQAESALAGDHRVVVKRRDQRRSILLDHLAGDGLPVLASNPVIEHHPGTVLTGGGDLGGRCVQGHDDRGPDPELARGQGHGLRVVSGRESHDASRTLLRCEQGQAREGAPGLEGSDALEGLALEDDAAAEALVDLP
jgi:hypothetical protein